MNAKLLFSLLFGLLLCSMGCFSSNQGGSLRQAMHKASDDNKGDRRVDGRIETASSQDTRTDFSPQHSSNRQNYPAHDRYAHHHYHHCPNPEKEDSPGFFGMLLDAMLTPSSSDEAADDMPATSSSNSDEEDDAPPADRVPNPSFGLAYAARPQVQRSPDTTADLSLTGSFQDLPGNFGKPAGVDSVKNLPPAESWNYNEGKNDFFGIRLLSGLKYSSHYSGIAGGSLVYAMHRQPHKRKAAYLGIASLPMDERSDLFGSIDDISELHLGYQFRGYSTPDYTWMGLFAHIGCEVKALFWDYNNPIFSDVTNEWGEVVERETITSDGVMGFNGNVGLGWSFLQTRNAKFSVEASAHFNAYWLNTMTGFTNDVFSPDMELRLTLEAAFGGRR